MPTKEEAMSDELRKEIAALYELMRNERLEELEIEEKDFYVHLKRKGKNVPKPASQVQSQAVSASVQDRIGAAPAEAPVPGDTIQSPIMGVFYRAPSPTLPSFVKEGDVVNPGKTLCIVEAMKVMNEIKADFKAKIVRILAENGSSVVAGQDLFVIEKA